MAALLIARVGVVRALPSRTALVVVLGLAGLAVWCLLGERWARSARRR